MDVITLCRRIKRGFGDEYDVIINDDDIFGWIFEAEMEIIRQTGQNEQIVSTTVGAFPLSVPDNVHIKRVVVNGSPLNNISREELDSMYAADSPTDSMPQVWYTVDRKVHFWPMKAGDTTAVKVYYAKTPVTITGTALVPTPNVLTVPEVHHNDVIKYVIAQAHLKNRDTDNASRMQDLFDRNTGARREEAVGTDGPLYKANDPLDYSDYPWDY